MLIEDIMALLNEKQIIKRRKKQILSFITDKDGDNKTRQKLPAGNFRKTVKKFCKSHRRLLVIAGSCTAVFILAALIVTISLTQPVKDFSLHKETYIESILLTHVSPEYDGRGSGEIPNHIPSMFTSIEPVEYRVLAGDTISEIADRYNLSEGTLISYNNIPNVRRLLAGQLINIPNMDGIPYVVRENDNINSIAKDRGISVNSILDANNLDTDVIQPGMVLFLPGVNMPEIEYKKAIGTLFVFPTIRNANLTSGYGIRKDPFTGVNRMHYGVDLACAVGNRVNASMAGTVVTVDERSLGYGKYIVISHQGGFQTLYGHLSRILVKKGQWVNQGQKIGEIGNTGRSTGPHLHFSIYERNRPVNPLNHLSR